MGIFKRIKQLVYKIPQGLRTVVHKALHKWLD